MTHSLDDGFCAFERALQRIANNPQRLEFERGRFDYSPSQTPRSTPATTCHDPSSPPRDGTPELKFKLGDQWGQSIPGNLWERQWSFEARRLKKAMKKGIVPFGDSGGLAADRVTADWIKQGIWDDAWGQVPKGWKPRIWDMWQHEHEKEPDHFQSRPPSQRSSAPASPKVAPPMNETDPDSKPSCPEARAAPSNASRPLSQFLYQVNKEREWFDLCHEAKPHKYAPADAIDANTRAYNSVKKRWKRWGIWNIEWGVLPGMSWKHEMPRWKFVEEDFKRRQTDAPKKSPVGVEDDEEEDLAEWTSYTRADSSTPPTRVEHSPVKLRTPILMGANTPVTPAEKSNRDEGRSSPAFDPCPVLSLDADTDSSFELVPLEPSDSSGHDIANMEDDSENSSDYAATIEHGHVFQAPPVLSTKSCVTQQPYRADSSPEFDAFKLDPNGGFRQTSTDPLPSRKRSATSESPGRSKLARCG